ncbi:MAG: hypothetical protein EOO40_07750, partial [Deltaproteobacteria bacterium]
MMALLAWCSWLCLGAAVSQDLAQGTIDWSARLVCVRGEAPPDWAEPNRAAGRQLVEEAAHHDAQARLVALLGAMPLRPSQTLGAALVGHQDRLAALARDMRVDETRYFSDGGVMVRAHLDFAAASLLHSTAAVPGPQPQSKQTPAGLVIISAAKLALTPCLQPRVFAAGTAETAEAASLIPGVTAS